MAFDREDTLKKAEKLLRQGKLEPAIAEYLRIVEADPGDWMTANTLGDLYVRAGQADKAASQYGRVAEHFVSEGFYPKAAAIVKKLLKLNPEDEASQLQLAEISQRQGLLADAKAHLNAVAARRRARGDRAGAAEIVVRLGDVDPNDFEARATAARTVAEMGDDDGAAARFRAIHDDLMEKDRPAEALEAMRQAVAHDPHDQDGRVTLAKAAVAAGDLEEARTYLDRKTAGDDPSLLLALIEVELKAGRLDKVRELLPSLLGLGRPQRDAVVALAWTTVGTDPETAFVLIQAAASQAATTGDVRGSAGLLEEFVARVPGHIPALSAYVQACVEGGLDDRVNDARGQLTDAYLSAGQAAEARDAAGDLIAREPWERAHMERFRRALVMLRIPDPDTVIADRLGGRTPFLATEIASSSASASASAATAYAPAEDTATSDPSPIGVADEAPVARSVQPGRGIPVSRLEPTDEGEIDLNSMLGGLEKDADQPEPGEPAAPSLGDAFKQVRQEVTRQGGVEASAQHMTLARTYLEMGLPDRAIEPLETAAESSQFRFEAASLLARIYMDRGDIDEAIEWLERAASVPAPTAEQGRSVAYDLALALEDRGESRRALAILLELQSEAGDYRDVADRIDLLSRHDGAAETETEG